MQICDDGVHGIDPGLRRTRVPAYPLRARDARPRARPERRVPILPALPGGVGRGRPHACQRAEQYAQQPPAWLPVTSPRHTCGKPPVPPPCVPPAGAGAQPRLNHADAPDARAWLIARCACCAAGQLCPVRRQACSGGHVVMHGPRAIGSMCPIARAACRSCSSPGACGDSPPVRGGRRRRAQLTWHAQGKLWRHRLLISMRSIEDS